MVIENISIGWTKNASTKGGMEFYKMVNIEYFVMVRKGSPVQAWLEAL
jgi:hypothetical protein